MVGISLTVEPKVLNRPFFTGTLSELAKSAYSNGMFITR